MKTITRLGIPRTSLSENSAPPPQKNQYMCAPDQVHPKTHTSNIQTSIHTNSFHTPKEQKMKKIRPCLFLQFTLYYTLYKTFNTDKLLSIGENHY